MKSFITQLHDNIGKGTATEPVKIGDTTISPQTNNWGCGPWSLRFCLLKWDHDVDPHHIARLGMSVRRGANDWHLELAAMRLGVDLKRHDVPTLALAKQIIDAELASGNALIMAVNEKHWIACLHSSRRGYLILDPGRFAPVVQLHGWKWLATELPIKDRKFRDDEFHHVILSVSKPVQLTL